jgi:hypothetical protein
MMLQQPSYYNWTPMFCEQFALIVEIRTYMIFKEEEGDKIVDLASTVIITIYRPFEDLVLKKERPITIGPMQYLWETVGRLSQKHLPALFSHHKILRNWMLCCGALQMVSSVNFC